MRWHALAATWGVLLGACACEERYTPLSPEQVSPVTPIPVPPEPPPAARAPTWGDVPEPEYRGEADGKLHVWFLDVGQGDAILIRAPNGRTVLVDGGPAEAGPHLRRRLPDLLQGPIDLVVVTHPHEDHFGGLLQALQVVPARRFLAPHTPENPPGQYAALLRYLEHRSIPIFVPAPDPKRPTEPVRLALGDGAELVMLWPRAPAEPHLDGEGDAALEANSLVMRLVYRNTSLLLMGDATGATERALLARGLPLRSTLLKVGAHGDAVGTTAALLEAVRPEAAVISAGAGNDRGAPSGEVLARLRAAGARVFRTDLDGEIRADSDGDSFVVVTERPAVGEAPDTPHLFGARDTESGARFAQAVAADVARRRSKQKVIEVGDELSQFGKVIDVRSDSPGTRQTRMASARGDVAEAAASEGSYVASRNSKVFHVPSCPAARRIHKKNRLVFSTRAEAANGRRPAGDCKP